MTPLPCQQLSFNSWVQALLSPKGELAARNGEIWTALPKDIAGYNRLQPPREPSLQKVTDINQAKSGS